MYVRRLTDIAIYTKQLTLILGAHREPREFGDGRAVHVDPRVTMLGFSVEAKI